MNRRSIFLRVIICCLAGILCTFTLAKRSSTTNLQTEAGREHSGVNIPSAMRAGAPGQIAAPAIPERSEPLPLDPPGATFNITWTACGTPPTGAVDALIYAAGLWGNLLTSTQTIDISACWIANPICGGIGCGEPAAHLRNFPQAPMADTYYPAALANALAGSDITQSTSDINLWFNANEEWSFATTGAPGSDTDFVSVAMHEIGHGLGFEGGMYESSNIGFCGTGPLYMNACPTAYDRLVVDSTGVRLMDYLDTNPPALGTRLKSDALSGGPNTLVTNGAAARLYTPGTWDQGSSLSHLDPVTFGGGSNKLMLPTYQSGARAPGPVTLAILQDMGWSLANGAANLASNGPLATGAGTDTLFSADLTWPGYAGQSMTYLWKASDQATVTHTLASQNDTLTLHWDDPGFKTLVVTALGGGVTAGTTRQILVFDVSMSGAAQGNTNQAYTFNASLAPDKTWLPVTYRWQASGHAPVIHTDQGTSDSLPFTWSLPGTQTITVTASIGARSAQDVRTIQITGSVLDHFLYLPSITRAP